MADGHELPRGVGGACFPGVFFEINMRRDAINLVHQ